MKIFLALMWAIIATPALAEPSIIGSFVINAFLSVGLGAALPAVSAAVVGAVVLRRLKR